MSLPGFQPTVQGNSNYMSYQLSFTPVEFSYDPLASTSFSTHQFSHLQSNRQPPQFPSTSSLLPPIPTFPPSFGETPSASSSLQVVSDVVAELGKVKFPELGETLGRLSLAGTVQESAKKIQGEVRDGKDPLASVVCETARAGVETALTALGQGAIIGGVPLYLGEIAAFPPLAGTLPLVGAMLPKALEGVEALAKQGGEKVESDCKTLFSVARAISSGEANDKN